MPRRSRSRRSGSRRSSTRRQRRAGHAVKLKLHRRQTNPLLPEKAKRISTSISVGRNKLAEDRGSAFVACVTFGRDLNCASSSNPSAAISKALHSTANKVGGRVSMFAGLGKFGGKRRRKSKR